MDSSPFAACLYLRILDDLRRPGDAVCPSMPHSASRGNLDAVLLVLACVLILVAIIVTLR